MDLKTILNDEKIVQTTDGNNGSDNSGTKHKKPIQLRDIESQSHNTLRLNSKLESKEEMKTLINKEKKDILKGSITSPYLRDLSIFLASPKK